MSAGGVARFGHRCNHCLLLVGECHADPSQRGNTGDGVVECFTDLQSAAIEVSAHRLANVEDCLCRTFEVHAFDLGERGENVVGAKDCVVTKQRRASAGTHRLRHVADLARGQLRRATGGLYNRFGLRHGTIPLRSLRNTSADEISDRTKCLTAELYREATKRLADTLQYAIHYRTHTAKRLACFACVLADTVKVVVDCLGRSTRIVFGLKPNQYCLFGHYFFALRSRIVCSMPIMTRSSWMVRHGTFSSSVGVQ